MHCRHRSGQSLAEYGLVIALVAIVCLVGLMALGNNIGPLLAGITQTLTGGQPANNNGTGNNNGQAGNGNANNNGNNAGSNPGAVAEGTVSATIRLSNGQTINLSSYPSDMSKSVQTVGASGTTDLVVAALRKMIQELEQSGQIDANQAASLRELANAGHDMARAHEMIENKVKACTGSQLFCLMGQEQVFGPKTSDSAFDAAKRLRREPGKEPGDLQARLDSAYERALADGSMSDPTVRKVVEVLKTQLDLMGTTMAETTYAQMNEGIGSGNPQLPVQDVVGNLAENLKNSSDANAANICTVGGDTDSGVSCQAG